jgi:hypothetical protein
MLWACNMAGCRDQSLLSMLVLLEIFPSILVFIRNSKYNRLDIATEGINILKSLVSFMIWCLVLNFFNQTSN